MTRKWIKDICRKEALKYHSRFEFQKNSPNVYSAAYKSGWLDDICGHMISPINPMNYWTKEKCQEEALKYNSRTEFSKRCKTGYSKSVKSGWLDDICGHMEKIGNRFNKCIYSYEFPDNYVYVGLTYNLDVRQKNRDNDINDQVIIHMKKTGLTPVKKQLTDYIDVNDAIKLEGYYVEKYKNNGWNILNKSKTGAIGGNVIKWTKEKCKEESLKYKSKIEFQKNSGGCYDAARRNGWLDDCCSHMVITQKPFGYWTFERCKEEALKYKTKGEFEKNSSAYLISCRNNWVNDICSHMIVRPNKIWTYDKCKKEASKYKTKIEFYKNSYGSYKASYRNGWLNEFFV